MAMDAAVSAVDVWIRHRGPQLEAAGRQGGLRKRRVHVPVEALVRHPEAVEPGGLLCRTSRAHRSGGRSPFVPMPNRTLIA